MPARSNDDKPTRAPLVLRLAGDLLGVAFLALAALFVLTSGAPGIPEARTPAFDQAAIVPSPMRPTLGDPPMVRIGGYDQRCNDCHRLFATNPNLDLKRTRTQHTEIILNHGMNDRCLNCHDLENRERLRLLDGSSVAFSDVAMLCAQCHGPVFRDWSRGVHGKTVGAWNPEMGIQEKYTCTNCHDPHAPSFPALAPLPGPNTLRMGERKGAIHEEISRQRSPLLLWKDSRDAESAGHDHEQSSHDEGGQR